MACCAVVAAAYLAWVPFRVPDEPRWARTLNAAAFLPLYWVAAALAWQAARHPALDARGRRSWRLIAASCALLALNNLLFFARINLVPGLDPHGVVATILPLLWYPLMVAALVGFAGPRQTGLEQTKFWLDGWTVFFAGCLVLFYAFARTPGHSSAATLRAALVTLAYPAMDGAVLFVAGAVLLRASAGVSRAAVALLAGSVALGVVADLGYGRAELVGAHRPGMWYEGVYILAALLVVVSAQAQRESADASSPVRRDEGPPPASALPYLAVGVALLFLLIELGPAWDTTMGGLVIGAATLTLLVLVRQLVSILEIRAMAARQRAQDVRFRSLVQHASDLVTIVDPRGLVTYQSGATERVLGRPAQAFDGRPLLALAHPDDATRVEAALDLAPVGDARLLRWRAAHADGGWRDLESMLTDLTRDPAVGGVVMNTRDVTEQLALQEQLRHAQKMEAVGLLAGGIAHDFNNVLAAIHTSAELIGMAGHDAEARQHDVQQIARAVQRAGSLTRQLLAFSRREVVQLQRLDLRAVVTAMEPMLRRLVTLEVALVVEVADDVVPIEADPGQIEQVILNLALNARDAMPTGGTLTLRAHRRRVADGIATLPPGEYAVLSVTDTGVGISDEVRPRIFEPFYSTKPRGEGSGLGLSTVYAIVTGAGGAVDLRTGAGRGSTFEAFFPLSAAVAGAEPPPARDAAARPGRETVLVVDDEPVIRRAVERYLAGQGYRVLSAADGEEALARLAAPEVRVDLLLTDMVMPGMDGGELISRARAHDADLPVLCMSGYTEDAALRGGASASRPAFIQKPFNLDTLGRMVRTALDGEERR